MSNFDPQQAMMIILALLVAIPVHEFAHALSAVNNGDEGPRRDGRLSIMPWDHFDPMGAFFCVMSAVFGFGLGWGKPVMVNPGSLHDPRWGMCKIAAWGPFSNFLLAIGFGLPIRLEWIDVTSPMATVFTWCALVNIGLMLFNLIPIGPLDGTKIVVAFLPTSQAYEYSKFMEQYGFMLLFGLIVFGRGLITALVRIPSYELMNLLVGPAWPLFL